MSTFGQNNKWVNEYVNKYGLIYRQPKNFEYRENSIAIIDGKLQAQLAGSLANLISKDKDIVVCIVFYDIDTTRGNMFLKRDGTYWSSNKNYLPRSEILEIFDQKDTKNINNADVSGTYDLEPWKVHLLSENEKCKVIFIHKEDRLDIELYCYYKPMKDKKLEKYIKSVRNLFKFNE
ncbi:MAG: hypothetical protein V4687_03025 [Bacteroidota bacterium]